MQNCRWSDYDGSQLVEYGNSSATLRDQVSGHGFECVLSALNHSLDPAFAQHGDGRLPLKARCRSSSQKLFDNNWIGGTRSCGRRAGGRQVPCWQALAGGRLRISGPLNVTLFPSFHLVAEEVGISQPAARGDTELATAKKLKFGLMLRGLLDGKMRMTEVTLIDPVIAVPTAPTKPVAGEQAVGAHGDRPGGGSTPGVAEQLSSLSLDKLVIENGTVILPPSGQTPGKRIEKLKLAASLPAFDGTLAFEAAAIVDGKAIKAAGSIGNFGRFLEGSPAPVSLQGNAPSYFEGKATLSGTATYKDNAFALSRFSKGAAVSTVLTMDQTTSGVCWGDMKLA